MPNIKAITKEAVESGTIKPDMFIKESATSTLKDEIEEIISALKSTKDILDSEMKGGGLSVNAYNINGLMPLYNGQRVNVSKTYNSIDNEINKLKSLEEDLEEARKTHRTQEEEKYKDVLDTIVKEKYNEWNSITVTKLETATVGDETQATSDSAMLYTFQKQKKDAAWSEYIKWRDRANRR